MYVYLNKSNFMVLQAGTNSTLLTIRKERSNKATFVTACVIFFFKLDFYINFYCIMIII